MEMLKCQGWWELEIKVMNTKDLQQLLTRTETYVTSAFQEWFWVVIYFILKIFIEI